MDEIKSQLRVKIGAADAAMISEIGRDQVAADGALKAAMQAYNIARRKIEGAHWALWAEIASQQGIDLPWGKWPKFDRSSGVADFGQLLGGETSDDGEENGDDSGEDQGVPEERFEQPEAVLVEDPPSDPPSEEQANGG